MKKLFLTLSLLGLSLTGLASTSAQYYSDYSSSYDYGSYTDSSYMSTSYAYPETSYYYGDYGDAYGGGHSSHYYHNSGAIASYTIGCTTYYYNTRTRVVVNTQNICTANTYTYPSYHYSHYTYPPQSQYCTYGYRNGSWYPCTSYSWFDNYSTGYQNYLNCYYDQYGRYICY